MNRVINSSDIVFDSNNNEGENSAESWSESIRKTFLNVSVELKQGSYFSGQLSSQDVGDLKVYEVYSSPQRIVRDEVHEGENPFEPVLLTVQLKGRGVFTSEAGTVTVDAGDLIVFDTHHYFDWEFQSSFGQLTILVPRDLLLQCQAVFKTVREDTFYGEKIFGVGLGGKIVRDFIFNVFVEDNKNDLSRLSQLFAVEQVWRMLIDLRYSNGLSVETSNLSASSIDIDKVDRFIRLNISNQQLSAEVIASAFQVSPRTIYKIFEENNMGLEKVIMEYRLMTLAECLVSPSYDSRSITDLIYDCGFTNNSHASSSFKAVFDMSPSAYRRVYRETSRSLTLFANRNLKK